MENPVREAVDRVGGPTKTTVLTGFSASSIHAWINAKKVPDARAAVLLAQASGVPIEALVGLPPSTNGQPKGGRRIASSKLPATSPAPEPGAPGGVSPAYPASPGTATTPATQALAA